MKTQVGWHITLGYITDIALWEWNKEKNHINSISNSYAVHCKWPSHNKKKKQFIFKYNLHSSHRMWYVLYAKRHFPYSLWLSKFTLYFCITHTHAWQARNPNSTPLPSSASSKNNHRKNYARCTNKDIKWMFTKGKMCAGVCALKVRAVCSAIVHQ